MSNKVNDARIMRIQRVLNDIQKAVNQIPRGNISQSAVRRIDDNKLVLQVIASNDAELAPVANKVSQAVDVFKSFARKFNAGNNADVEARDFERLMNEIAEMTV
ncbi:hypothetical protein [Calidifontibacillus erzurumensis]|uniref:Uncharacterized protein n=1 Tax=Calidifontibacillus erzurumensis TaxID=2741433 RepID=A0A8J8GE51_9BACI|nr:hypothetical protein [Calidifontibacillus erzurumensis]NSL51702.1 hypothetical protein [Calidifontibacillus erzurumensis]